MTILTLLPDDHPALRVPSSEVGTFDAATRSICMDLLFTMQAKEGLGLAAPQVGIQSRIIAVAFAPFILINPVITFRGGEQVCREGCLSFPGQFYDIKRAERVSVHFQTMSGDRQVIAENGLNAVVLQHEIDHLNGVLFTDHLTFLKRQFFQKWCKRHLPVSKAEIDCVKLRKPFREKKNRFLWHS